MTGTGGGGGGAGANPDAKPDTLAAPDTALPKDVPPGTGGATVAPDTGFDQTTLGGTGGTATLDGGTDVNPSGSEAGQDVAWQDTQIPDVPLNPDGGGFVDVASVETGSSEGGSPSCQGPTLARSYRLPSLLTVAWAKDGSLATGGAFLPNDTILGTKTLTNQGASDMFVAKIDPTTGDATWVLTAGDDADQLASQVATSGNAVFGVIGNYLGSMEIVTGSPLSNPLSTPVDYIAGIDGTAGAGLWSKSVNLGTGQLNAIAGNTTQNFFVVCGAATNAAAQLGVTGATPGGGKDVVVAAVNAIDGTVIWARLFGGPMDQVCNAAAIDDTGNVLLTGQYAGTLDFGTGPLTPAPTGARDKILWVAKLNGTTGAAIGAIAFGASGQIVAQSIAADAQGNAFVTGIFSSAFSAGTTSLTPLGPFDSFVLKVSSGLVPIWARRWGAANKTSGSFGIATDSSGNPTVVGSFQGTIDIGPGNATLSANVPAGGGLDVLIVRLDGVTGATTCAHHYGDSALTASQDGRAVAINRWTAGAGKDGLAVVGDYTGVIDFGPPTTALGAGSSISTAGYLLDLQP